MNFEDLKNPELQEKLKSAKTFEELVAIAKEEGIELSKEQLEDLSGGDQGSRCANNVKRPIGCPVLLLS